jgi:hypothetical protein
LASCIVGMVLLGARSEAHKPITSPYTFNDDVFPILRDRCGRCHVAGGVAPMPLMTHQDTVPWGESLRLELIAGHMPPWSAATTAGRFHHTPGLSARELDTVLTWASGGTPHGDESKAPPPVSVGRTWRLGIPDLVLQLPSFTLSANAQDQVAEFVVPVGRRAIRAIDLMPGTPAIVRSATVSVGGGAPLLLWQPGDEPVALDNAAFVLPVGAELVVTVRYKKTWGYERQEMTDRSAIGLYVTDASRPAVETLRVTVPGIELDRDRRILAIAPDPALADTDIRLEATRPDGSRDTLIAFRPTAGWTRRYWFETPIALPRGTRIGISAAPAGKIRPTLYLDVT